MFALMFTMYIFNYHSLASNIIKFYVWYKNLISVYIHFTPLGLYQVSHNWHLIMVEIFLYIFTIFALSKTIIF